MNKFSTYFQTLSNKQKILLFAVALFFLSLVVGVAVTLLSHPKDEKISVPARPRVSASSARHRLREEVAVVKANIAASSESADIQGLSCDRSGVVSHSGCEVSNECQFLLWFE